MKAMPNMVDMARSPVEKSAEAQEMLTSAVADIPTYPYGLNICFDNEVLEKLDMDEDVQVGDYVHIHAFAKVTSVSERDINGQPDRRVELTMTHISAEDEDEENEDDEANELPVLTALYANKA